MGSLFTHCSRTVHVLKNIKNRSHNTIYVFKNYFTTVLSIFSFRNNKFTSKEPKNNACQCVAELAFVLGNSVDNSLKKKNLLLFWLGQKAVTVPLL